jgi:hypothetical protein
MGFDQLFLDYRGITFMEIVMRTALAFLLGLGVSQIYRSTHKGPSFSPSFVKTLVILSMVTSVVMMIIGNSLARAFGLVGTMAIIRFRTALKETRDIAFVFFALSVGMAAGTGSYAIAIIGSIVISALILLITVVRLASRPKRAFLLTFQLPPTDRPEQRYIDVFRTFLSSWRILDMRSIKTGQFLDLSFEVKFKSRGESAEFVAALSRITGLDRIHLVLGDQETEMTL